MANFPPPNFIQTNGIKMAVYEQGAGVPVVMCHGFPELAYSWRHQLPAVAGAGFRAIAPDMRGYGLTDSPEKVEAYDMEHLAGDLVGLLDALELEKAVFVGHDWGGIVVWQMPYLHPDRVAGIIGVNTPSLPRPPIDPIELFRSMYGEDMYIVHFQKPGEADAVLNADPARALRYFYRQNPLTQAQYQALPKEKKGLPLIKAMQNPEESWSNDLVVNAEELAFYTEAFVRTGFTGGINWYRNFTRNWERSVGQDPAITVPCLMLSAENDVVLSPAMAEPMKAWVTDLESHIIPDSGHWTQSEQPETLNKLMVDWLKRRF